MKILFFDLRKEVCDKIKALNLDCVEVRNCDLSKIKADAVSTCSNPDFTFGGGIDLALQKRFDLQKGEWLDIQKGDKKIKNVVLNITVEFDLITDFELVRKAYANYFNVGKNNNWEIIACSGFGIGIGGLSVNEMVKAFREAVRMYKTSIGKDNVPIIGVQNLIIKNCDYMQPESCYNMQAKNCDNMQAKNCFCMQAENCAKMQAENCDNMQAEDCNDMQAEDCNDMQAENCYNMHAKSCDSMQANLCNGLQANLCNDMQANLCNDMQTKDCDNMQAENCDYMQAESCNDMQPESCDNMQADNCDYMQPESCNNMQAKNCNSMQAENCDYMQAKDCNSIQAEDCYCLFLLDCSGITNTCYVIEHNCELEYKNKQKKTDFKKIFLAQFYDIKTKKHIAYKYLTEDMLSPLSTKKIKYKIGKVYNEKCDKNKKDDCSYGINLASIYWCKKEKSDTDIIVSFEFDPGNAVVPINTYGKFRVSKAKCLGIVNL